jgi:predicted GNAT family acetyltransferase
MTDFRLNEAESRFELQIGNETAFIDCLVKADVMLLVHTEVPAALGGQGIGTRIVELALHYIDDHGYKLAPLCPFVGKYVRLHPEWQRLLAPGYKL